MPDEPAEQAFENPGTVAELAELYLGNILYAMERAALAMEADGGSDNAAFYRGIARALAAARGRTKGSA